MKKFLVILLLMFAQLSAFAQGGNPNYSGLSCYPLNRSCTYTKYESRYFLHESQCVQSLQTFYRYFEMTDPGDITFFSNGHTGSYILYGPMLQYDSTSCEQIEQGLVPHVSGIVADTFDVPHSSGFYLLKVTLTNCIYVQQAQNYKAYITIGAPKAFCTEDRKKPCKDCIASFSPDPGKYLISAWAKDDLSNKNKGYDYPKLTTSFVGDPNTFNFKPSGPVIDGWQRIEGIVQVPIGATKIKIGLNCEQGNCLFDDIRFVPVDGSMVSYVYDPITLRLVAELDERNFATFYEYDEEGKLIRTKKETEKGIMTISEGRNNIRK